MALEGYRGLLARVRGRLPVEWGNYPYVTARVKAKKALLVPKDAYPKLLQMSIPEITRFLGEGQYKEEVVALGTRYEGVELLERATRNNLSRVFTQIIGFSEGRLREMVARFLDRWDVWNIKTILRGRFYGASEEEIVENLLPAGSLSRKVLEGLVAMEDLAGVVDALGETPYGAVLVGLPTSLEDVRSLAPYEDLLDKVYYETLLDAVPPTPEPQRLFHNFLRMEIDVVNTKTLLRIRGLEEVAARGPFIRGGLTFTADEMREMASLELPVLLNRLRKAPFHEELAPHLQADEPRLAHATRALERWLLSQAATGANLHPLSILPVLDYLVAKAREVENLGIIARGKAHGLERDVIKDMLVV